MILVDTNLLLRSIETGHVHRQAAIDSVIQLQQSEDLVVVPQILMEFYAAVTRGENSLHLSPDEAIAELAKIKTNFELYEETPHVFPTWEMLVAKYKLKNRHVFDLRIVANMLIHGIESILSFNDAHFAPFNEIRVLNPFDYLGIPRVK